MKNTIYDLLLGYKWNNKDRAWDKVEYEPPKYDLVEIIKKDEKLQERLEFAILRLEFEIVYLKRMIELFEERIDWLCDNDQFCRMILNDVLDITDRRELTKAEMAKMCLEALLRRAIPDKYKAPDPEPDRYYDQVVLDQANSVPIRDLVDFTLKSAGSGRYKGLCPFHSEKQESFTIFNNNTYYCFGCQESGDAIKFTMQLYNLPFKEAVKRLVGK